MKQVQQNYRTGELSVEDMPVPRVNSGGVLVATSCSLISSGTEKQALDLAKASLAGKAVARPDLVRQVIRKMRSEGVAPTIKKVFVKLDTPIPLGYSLAGEIVELGDRVNGYEVGGRVACAGAGLANHAEYNVVPAMLTVPIPPGVDDEDASFVTLGAIAMQGVRLAQPTLGERVVVMGLGLIGLLTVQMLKANGCRVLGFDPQESRAKLARELGANVAVSSGLPEATAAFTRGQGADAVILTASSKASDPLNQAAEISRLKGRIVVVGLVGMSIDREPFYKRELELKVSMSYGPGRHDPNYEIAGNDYPLPYVRWTERRNMESFLELVQDGRVTPKKLVTHRFPIAQAEKAYEVLERGEPHLAILLTYPEEMRSAVERAVPTQKGGVAGQGVAFVGFGNYAKGALLPALLAVDGIKLTSVVTATGLSASHASKKFGFARASTDPADAFDDPETGVVFIATRHDSHAAFCAAALRKHKNVFCEKPLALTRESLADTLDAARHSKGVLTVGFNRRFAPLLVKAKEALAPRGGPLLMSYRINAGAIPLDSWIQRDEGGGRILGEVCHFVDAMTYLADSLPESVFATATNAARDSLAIVVRFRDGSAGTILYSSNGDASVPKEYLEIFAPGRVLQLEDFRRLTISRHGRQAVTKQMMDKGQKDFVAAFVKAARGQGPTPIPLEELAAVAEATFAIQDSLRLGSVVQLT